MLTALSVQVPEQAQGLQKLARRLRRDKIEVQISRARGVSLRHVTYISYSGEVRLDRADRVIGEQRGQLLCSDKLIFPRHSGYRRFKSASFSSRLCTNFALAVLAECEEAAALRLGVYDPRGVAADFVYHALQYCVNPTVITAGGETYSLLRERALNELGASLTVTTQTDLLRQCDFVVAPSGIDLPLHVKPEAVVLTTGEPMNVIGGEVYHCYHFRMPNGFDTLKPRELSEEYFCSALYTLGAQYELGSLVPLSCTGSDSSQTVKSLANWLDIQAKKSYNS